MGRSKDLANGETRFANVAGDTFTGLVNITNTYSSDTTEQLRVSDNTGSKLDFFGHANGTKSIQAYADDGSTFYNLNLQPLGGYVTTPNQPAFHVGVSSNQTLAAGDTVVFQQQFENRGSHYNTSNGLFTAPVTGFYSFTYRLLHESVSNGHAVDSYLSKNNSATAGNAFLSQRYKYQADYTGHTGYLSESSSGMIYLAANDTMRVRYSGGQNSTIHNNQNWSYFCGHLIG